MILNNMENKYLCCLASLTLLGIVDKHSIDIDYNETAIVKAFKSILVKLELLFNGQES